MRTILTSIIMALTAIAALGATSTDSVKVYFLVGRRLFDPSLGNNRAAMDAFIGKVLEAKAQDNIEKITVSGYASPDGASDANLRLSGLRCDEIANYIASHTGIDKKLILTKAEGVAWTELRNLVAQHPDMPSQKKVLFIIDNTPLWIYNSEKTKIIDGKKKQLMEIDGGRVWTWMMTNLFPELRNALAVMLYLKLNPETPAAVNSSNPDAISTVDITPTNDDIISITEDNTTSSELSMPSSMEFSSAEEIETTKPGISGEPALLESTDSVVTNVTDIASFLDGKCVSVSLLGKPFYMAVKTNMLFDAALIPNLGAEFYLGKNFSIYGEWMYAWWENQRRHQSWRIYGGDLRLRWWFGRKAHTKPLTGHHFGVYGGIITFDFATGDKGFLGGKPKGTLWDRHLINAGIEYGYSLPVAKRLNIDFSIGLGYLGGHYIKYYPFDNDLYLDKEINLRFFGPTKGEISLVWLIGHGNTNDRKGGER